MAGTEGLLPLCVNCPSSLESSKSLQGGIPPNTAGAICRCDPAGRCRNNFPRCWSIHRLHRLLDPAAFINTYPKKGHRIMSTALEHIVLKRGTDSFSEMKLLLNSG